MRTDIGQYRDPTLRRIVSTDPDLVGSDRSFCLVKQAKFIAFIIRLAPFTKKDEGIVRALGNKWRDSDVGSSHPGAGEGPKGRAVRPLKWYASWVQSVVRQLGLYPVQPFQI